MVPSLHSRLCQQVFWAENKRNCHRLQINEIHLLHNNGCIFLTSIHWIEGRSEPIPALRNGTGYMPFSWSSVAWREGQVAVSQPLFLLVTHTNKLPWGSSCPIRSLFWPYFARNMSSLSRIQAIRPDQTRSDKIKEWPGTFARTWMRSDSQSPTFLLPDFKSAPRMQIDLSLLPAQARGGNSWPRPGQLSQWLATNSAAQLSARGRRMLFGISWTRPKSLGPGQMFVAYGEERSFIVWVACGIHSLRIMRIVILLGSSELQTPSE